MEVKKQQEVSGEPVLRASLVAQFVEQFTILPLEKSEPSEFVRPNFK